MSNPTIDEYLLKGYKITSRRTKYNAAHQRLTIEIEMTPPLPKPEMIDITFGFSEKSKS